MQTNYLITVDKFCSNHNIEISFISSLQQNGMIDITVIEEVKYIDPDQLLLLEKIVRLYFELDINLEGIETINYLLQRIENMHNKITKLRNKIRLYELNDEE